MDTVEKSPGQTNKTPKDSLVVSAESLRSVVGLNADNSRDALLETLSKSAQSQVNAMLGFSVQGETVTDYYDEFASVYNLSETPAVRGIVIGASGFVSDESWQWEIGTNEPTLYGMKTHQNLDLPYDPVIIQTALSGGRDFPSVDSGDEFLPGCNHIYDVTANRIYYLGQDLIAKVTNPLECIFSRSEWAETDTLSKSVKYPVSWIYETSAQDYEGVITSAIEQLVLVMYSNRTGLNIPVGPVLANTRELLRPLSRIIV